MYDILKRLLWCMNVEVPFREYTDQVRMRKEESDVSSVAW